MMDPVCANNVGSGSSQSSSLDRLNDAVDQITAKRPETRVKSLTLIVDHLRSIILDADEDWTYSETFLSGLDFVLKKGRPVDQTLAVSALSIFCLQSSQISVADYYTKFHRQLESITRNDHNPVAYRAACSMSLAIFHFLTDRRDIIHPIELLKLYEGIFKGSCLKGDGKAPVLESPVVDLHVAALHSWSLVFCSLQKADVESVAKLILPLLLSLLQASAVDIRIAAGEVVALVYERLRADVDPRYRGPYYTPIVELLSDLATDCNKARSKHDKKKQRHSFRDFFEGVSKNEARESQIVVGQEKLVLQGYIQHSVYNALCELLRGGVNIHLRCNHVVRDLFDLGDPELETEVDPRLEKEERRKVFAVTSKARTNKRGQLQDIRNLAFNESE